MRISIYKSKDVERLYVIKNVTIKGKRTSKTVESLGKMTDLMTKHGLDRDGVIAWAKGYAKELAQKVEKDNAQVIVKFSTSKKIEKGERRGLTGGYLVLKKLLADLKLNELCRDIASRHAFKYDLTDILATLVYTRIINPGSKLAALEEAQNFIEKPKFEQHQIYRALEVICKEKANIESALYHASNKVVKRNTNVLYFDCTNYFFEIDEAEGLKQYGKSKENKPNPIVQMGVFLDGNGIPLAFCLNPGNTSEQKVLKPLQRQMMKDFDISNCVVCTDAGLASRSNRVFNNVSSRSYIVTQSIKKLKGHLKEFCLSPDGWRLLSNQARNKESQNRVYCLGEIDDKDHINHIFYKERWINEGGLQERLIVSYSPKQKLYQREVRNGQVSRAQGMIDRGDYRKGNKQNNPARFVEEKSITDDGELAQKKIRTLDADKISEEERYDGFYAVCTTLEDDVTEVIRINRRRWEIEESFRIMKSELKARPVFLKRDDRITAHFITCFVALLTYRLLERKLDEKYTVHEISKALRDMNFLHIEGEGYVPTYTRTDIFDDLNSLLPDSIDTQIVSEKKMKNILRLLNS